MGQLTANDLKVRGIAAIEDALAGQAEATISVRGTQRFVVMEVAQYHYLRECELEAALAQSHAQRRKPSERGLSSRWPTPWSSQMTTPAVRCAF